jgi:hypothetical protein
VPYTNEIRVDFVIIWFAHSNNNFNISSLFKLLLLINFLIKLAVKQFVVEMMVMALGETCWNNEEGYH